MALPKPLIYVIVAVGLLILFYVFNLEKSDQPFQEKSASSYELVDQSTITIMEQLKQQKLNNNNNNNNKQNDENGNELDCKGKSQVILTTIATGKYIKLGMDSLRSAKTLFCHDCCRLSLHILTDQDPNTFLNEEEKKYIQVHKIEARPWPQNTLMKFTDLIQKIGYDIYKHDYFFFADADTRFVQNVTIEELKGKITAVLHPYYPHNDSGFCGRYGKYEETNAHGFDHSSTFTFCQYPYERNTMSEAGVDDMYGKKPPKWDHGNSFYYQAAFWGGESKQMIEMMKSLDVAIKKDLDKGYVASMHDESHLNKYLIGKESIIHQVGPEYIYPEPPLPHINQMDWLYEIKPKIVHVRKDANALRN